MRVELRRSENGRCDAGAIIDRVGARREISDAFEHGSTSVSETLERIDGCDDRRGSHGSASRGTRRSCSIRWRLSFSLAAILSAACARSAPPATPEHGGPAWREITTEHMVIDTDLDANDAITAAQQLEILRDVFVQGFFRREPRPSPRLRVIALRREEYIQYDPSDRGMFVDELLYEPALVTTPGGQWGTHAFEIRAHELAHAMASRYIDLALQPRWFAEGLAMAFQTVTYDSDRNEFELGRAPPNFEYLYESLEGEPDRIYSADIWDWSHGPTDPFDDDGLYYSISWAMVRALMDQRPNELAQYEQALASGRDAKTAWMAVFPDLDGHGLARMVKNYLRLTRFQTSRIRLAAAPAHVESAHVLSEADILGIRAMLNGGLPASGRRSPSESRALAQSEITDSLRHDDASLWAHLVRFAYFNETPNTAIARRTLEAHRDDWRAWMWYGAVLANRDRRIDEARIAVREAIGLAPGVHFPLIFASQIEGIAGRWDEALQFAQQAVRLAPSRVDAVLAYATALTRLGRCSEAMRAQEGLGRSSKAMTKNWLRALRRNVEACGAK